MVHLPVHLPYEAKIAGPVQYRWMYPFERLLHELKKDVKNKARVEGSICNAFLVREASIFYSHYFEPHVHTRSRKVPRNDDGGAKDDAEEIPSTFSHPGRPYGKLKNRMLTEEELKAAHSSFLERVDPDGYKWANLSTATIQFYWDELQKNCYWDPSLANQVKVTWENKAKERYRQYIYNMSSITRNPTRKKPTHVFSEVWTAWNTMWNTEEFKKISEQSKKNRRKGVVDGRALPTHNGGSACYLQIADNMEKSLGCPPSTFDVFIYTHTKDHDGKTFIVDKAKQVHDKFKSRHDELVALGEEVDDGDLFYEAVGGHDHKKDFMDLVHMENTFFQLATLLKHLLH